MNRRLITGFVAVFGISVTANGFAADIVVTETDQEVRIITPQLEAAVRKTGYVSGVYRQTFLDKTTGFRDPGFGLDIVDWLMEPMTGAADRNPADGPLAYSYNNLYHGKRLKRSIEGPQICTKARELHPVVMRGDDFVAVTQQYKYHIAAPEKKTGSLWTQILIFPVGKRYFLSMDRIDSVNDSDGLFLRIDMPGHVKHKQGDTFSEIYLSYHGRIPASEFFEDFATGREVQLSTRPEQDSRTLHPSDQAARLEDWTRRTMAGRNDARPIPSSTKHGVISEATFA